MFELIRQFRQWVMIGAIILVSFAFGITGVVYSVLEPTRNPGEEVIGTYSLGAVGKSDQTVKVKRQEFDRFEPRWDQFLVEHLSGSRGAQMLFGQGMDRGGRMYQMAIRLTMRQAMQQNPFFRFIPYVQSQYQVDLIRNVLFLRSGSDGLEGEEVFLTSPVDEERLEGMEDMRKVRVRQRNWQREAVWRLHYVLSLAEHAGFSATDQEIREVVQPFLNQASQRGKRRISYQQFVEQQGRMTVGQFEKTLKEFLTIMKYLGSLSTSTAVEGSELLSGLDQDVGYGALLVSNIDHQNVQEQLYGNRSWRLRQRFLSPFSIADGVEVFRSFADEVSSSQADRPQPGQQGDSEKAPHEKRQFGYLYLSVDAYLDQVEDPSNDRLKSYYENNKDSKYIWDKTPAGGEGDEPSDANSEASESTEYVPFDQVSDEIRETLIRERALRKADSEVKKLINSTISRKEIRGEPVDFQQIAEEADLRGDLEYRKSPLLDEEDMTYYLKEIRGAESSHLENLKEFVFEKELDEEGRGPYPNETIWFRNGVVLPRLIRVKSDLLKPSASFGSDGGTERNTMTLSQFSETYPLPSLQLEDVLKWRLLRRQTKNRVEAIQQQFASRFVARREELWKGNEIYGPPVPPRYYPGSNLSKEKEKTEDEQDETQGADTLARSWPPGAFRSDVLDNHILYSQRKWQLARKAFRETARGAGLEVQETNAFKLSDGPADVDLLEEIRSRLTGGGQPRGRSRNAEAAELFEPLQGTGENRSQVAVLHKKLPKRSRDLEEFIKERRPGKVTSARSRYLSRKMITLIEQANFTHSNEEGGTNNTPAQ